MADQDKKLLISVLIMVLVGALIFFMPTNESLAPTRDVDLDIPDDWLSYSNVAFDFTFRYPPNSTLQHESGNVKIQMIGPEHTEGEITDGFTFFIDSQPISNKLTLEEFSYQKFVEENEDFQPIEEPHRVTIGNREAYRSSLRGVMGSRIDRVYMEAVGQNVFMISYIISGPDDREYREIINKMIRSASIEAESS